jgi:hypothetical protein
MNRRDFVRNAITGLFVLKAAPLIFDMGANSYRLPIVPGGPALTEEEIRRFAALFKENFRKRLEVDMRKESYFHMLLWPNNPYDLNA